MPSGLPLWEPNGLPNLERVIAKVNPHGIEKFFIPFKISWKVDFKNGLARPI